MEDNFEKVRQLAIQQSETFKKSASSLDQNDEDAKQSARSDLYLWKAALKMALGSNKLVVQIDSNWSLSAGRKNNKSIHGFDSVRFFSQRSTEFREIYRLELESLLGKPFKVGHNYIPCDGDEYSSPPHWVFFITWFGF